MDSNQDTDVTVTVVDSLQDKVVALIAILTGQNAVFTAFDITKQLRIENPTMDIPHREVRDIVLQEWKNTFCDEYESTLTELSVGSDAFVYHPETVSPSTHPLAVQPLMGSGFGGDDMEEDSDLTVEKRLNVSKEFLRPMNLTAGKLVKVSTTNGVMSIVATTDPSGETVVVNADGRLRLGEKMLTRAFGQLHTKYNIALSSDKSVIKVQPRD